MPKSPVVVVVMAVHGRDELTLATVKRLQRQSLRPFKVIVIGDLSYDVARELDGFISYKNKPLGEKWQMGVDIARLFDPDAICILGSDDWLTDEYLATSMALIRDGCDVACCKVFYMYEIEEMAGHRPLYRWGGYSPKLDHDRVDEPIGAGRVFSGSVLRRLGWRLFDDNIDNSLDHDCYKRLRSVKARIEFMDDSCCVMGIGFHGYEYKHRLNKETIDAVFSYPMVNLCDERIAKSFLAQQFPGAMDLVLGVPA